MRAFLVQIKDGARVIHEFGAMGSDSITVAQQHECLAEDGQFVRVTPVKSEPFPVMAVRNELAQLALRQPIAESDWVTFDNERDVNKGPRLAARGDRMALELQVQEMRCAGVL